MLGVLNMLQKDMDLRPEGKETAWQNQIAGKWANR